MTDEIILKKIGEWTVTVSSYNGNFSAAKGEQRIESVDTLGKLEELIKRQDSDDRNFKPIDVIQVEGDRVGRLVSWVARSGDRESTDVYFTFKDKGDLKASRTACSLTKYYWEGGGKDQAKFVKASPENLEILSDIRALRDVIKAHENAMTELRKRYGDPITKETIKGGT